MRTISTAGVYKLNTDLSSSSTCIRITSSDVVFDGQGHMIDGPGPSIYDYYGIYVYNSSSITNVTVKNVTVTDWERGVSYGNADNGIIENNTASNNYYGISFYSSSNNTIANNTAISNTKYGIHLRYSASNILKDNNMSLNTYNFWIYGSSTSHYIQDIDITNKVDGKPIYYLIGDYDRVINSSTSAGYVGVVNGINITVKDLKLTKNMQGVLFVNTSNSSVLNVTTSDNGYGIYLYSSSDNNITNNNASNNDFGIRLYSSSNNTLTNNNASNNNGVGILLYPSSNNNTLANNNASNNKYGIRLSSSSNNTLTDNNASNNNRNGIYLSYYSKNNNIYNNFFNNTNNAGFSGMNTNTWNTTKTPGTNIIGGPYLAGNYWANPSGSGFSETCTDADNDGICDSNYTLASGNVDYLPLTSGGSESGRPPINLKLSYKNTIYLGNSIDINIKVFNGSTPITANIEVKINGDVVADVNTYEYTYIFSPEKIGSYTIEVTAASGNLKKTKIAKIEVIGNLSGILALNEHTESLAYSEIDQAVLIPANKAVDLAISYTTGVVANALMKVISPLVDLAGDFVADAYIENLDYLADHLGYLYEEVLSEILNEDISIAIGLGFSSVEEHAIYYVKEVILESIPFLKVNEERSKITGNSIEFDEYIEANPQEFLKDTEGVRRIFIISSEPIRHVVETHPIASLTIDIPLLGSLYYRKLDNVR